MVELSEMERDMLAEVGNIGAGHASNALSRMVGKQVDMSVPSASIVPISQLPDEVDNGEDIVTGIYVPVSGDLQGGVMLILPHRSALKLADELMDREIGTASRLSEMDKSSLKEVGNILVGHCLTALSTFLRMDLQEDVPEIASDSAMALMDTIAAEFSQEAEHALKIDEFMSIESELELKFSFFLIFSLEDAEGVISKIKEQVK